MIKFDLEKALAGDKVVTRGGEEVTQLYKFKGLQQDQEPLYCVVDEVVRCFFSDGVYDSDLPEGIYDLFMSPKQLSGFMHVYSDGGIGVTHKTKDDSKKYGGDRVKIACIDLSQFKEGEGL